MKKLASFLSLIVLFPFLASAQSAGQGNSQNAAPSAIQSQSSGTAQNVSIADLQKIIQDLVKQVQ
ncbi:MAG: hypothetical protein HY434_00915, partial [Candidatus Liptonbacteria bacterium]|nr:hypothetical protein [Candidatus Liptonbacteria bacterium]